MGEPDDRYPSLREHMDVRERVTSLEGGLTNITATLSRIESRQLTANAPPPVDHMALAIQRALDMAGQKSNGGAGIGTMILIGFGMFGVGVACFLIGKVFF